MNDNNIRRLRDIGVERLLNFLQERGDDIEAIVVCYQTKTDPPYTCWSVMKGRNVIVLECENGRRHKTGTFWITKHVKYLESREKNGQDLFKRINMRRDMYFFP
jgi:hypothetical protein